MKETLNEKRTIEEGNFQQIREAIIESYIEAFSGVLEPYEIMSLVEQRICELLEEDETWEDGEEYPDFD